MALILATATNPGTAVWTTTGTLGIGAFINRASETQNCTTSSLLFSDVAITIPANRLANGVALTFGCRWEIDTSALPNPDFTTVVFGYEIQGIATQVSGVFVPATCDPYVQYAGTAMNGSATIAGGSLTIASLVFMQQTSTINGFGSLIGATVPLDFTQDCTIIPSITITSVPDPLVTVTAAGLVVQVLYPA